MPVTNALYTLLAGIGGVTSLLSTPPAAVGGASIYIGAADKGAVAPYLVLHLVTAKPQSTLQGPSALRDGEFQFDSYAPTQSAARLLSQAVRGSLEGWGGVLADGTTLQFVETLVDDDDGYEQGDIGYVFRAILRLQGFYTESGGVAPASGVTRYALTLVSSGPPAVYSVPVTIGPSGQLFRNGELLSSPGDYTYSGTNIVFVISPASDDVMAFYQ